MIFNGTNIIVYDNDIAIGHSTNASLQMSMDVAECSNKNSGGWYEGIAGKRTAKIRLEGLVDYSDQFNYKELVNLLITKKYTKFVFQGASMFYFGGGYVTDVEQVAEAEKTVSYGVDMVIDGRVYFEPRLPWNLVFTNWENVNINWQNV